MLPRNTNKLDSKEATGLRKGPKPSHSGANPQLNGTKTKQNVAIPRPKYAAPDPTLRGKPAKIRGIRNSPSIYKNGPPGQTLTRTQPLQLSLYRSTIGNLAAAHCDELLAGSFLGIYREGAYFAYGGAPPSEVPGVSCVFGVESGARDGAFWLSAEEFAHFRTRLESSDRVAVDTETVCERDINDPRYVLEAQIRLLCLKVAGHPAVAIDLFEVTDPVHLAEIRNALAGKDLVIYNALFDLPVLARNLGGPIAYRSLFDPMVAAVLIDNVARPRESDGGEEAVVLPALVDVLYRWTDIRLDKTLQNSDWAAMVLEPGQVNTRFVTSSISFY